MRASIVIPCYNAESFLGKAIESALAQTHPETEVIVVDDGSTDGSAQVAARYEARVRLIRTPHGGGSMARNAGLRIAAGEAVVFLDADDLLGIDTVAHQVRALERSSPRSIARAPWAPLALRQEAWVPVPRAFPARPSMDAIAARLVSVFDPTAALLWPTALVRELGGWDETLTKNQDGDLVLRALLAGARYEPASGSPVFYRTYGAASRSVSSGRAEGDLQSCMRVLEKATDTLRASGRFKTYRLWVGRGYHDLARGHYFALPELSLECVRRGLALVGRDSIWGPRSHVLLTRLLGFERKERLAAALARMGFGRAGRRVRTRLLEESHSGGRSG